jgi:L-alanine-DL-glutamate epimerase-like enolase superfamily enzyme
MKVTSIDVHILENREGYGLAADGEESLGPRFVSVIQVNTDEGISGIADCDSHPHVIRAFLEAPRNIPGFSEGLQYAVIGEDPFQLEKIRRKMYDVSYYHGRTGAVIQAMSAIDIALWDILGKACRRSVSEMMGARQHERIRAYASTLFRSTPDAMRRAVNAYRERGYTAIKFGWGVFTESSYVALKLVEAARSEAGEDLDLMVDGLWTRDVSLAIDIVKRLEALGVFFVEEPLVSDNLAGYRALHGAVNMRIAAGE